MVAQFQFVMRSGPNTGKIYPLEAPEIMIGRDTSNGVAINDAEVSRKHAKLSLQGSAYVIQDLGSTNGSFVNGQRISGPQVLNPGDSVSFGENIVVTYEAVFDSNATVIASAKAPKTVMSVSKPVPAPHPAPAYSGHIPAGPIPMAVVPSKKKFPIWLVFVIVILVIICACVSFFAIIDQLNLWCKVLPFLVPYLGGSCP
jgi:uncharacterized membrane protein